MLVQRLILAGMTEQTRFPHKTVFLLTATGAIPFIALAVAMGLLSAPTNSTAALWLQTYSAVILSFLGGIRWGLALAGRDPKASTFVLSVWPSLAGWAILPPAIILAPGPVWFLAYAGLFALPLRLGVSLVVIASLVGAWGVQRFLF